MYYNTDLSLEKPKNILICKNVTSIKEETYKGYSNNNSNICYYYYFIIIIVIKVVMV